MNDPTNKEAGEIFTKGMKLTTLKRMPFVKKEQIWKEYNNFINSLSQETFDHNIIKIIQMIDYGGKSASDYKNSQEAFGVMVVRWSRLGQYQGALLEWIKTCRKDGGFEV